MFRLVTKEGAHIADVNVPPFETNPDVLVWGDRVFQFGSAIMVADDPCTAAYKEASCFYVPIPVLERAESPAFQKPAEGEADKD